MPVDFETLDEVDLRPEAKHFLGFRLNTGTSTPRKRRSAWARQDPDGFWSAIVRERIAAQVERIRHWTVIEGNYTQAPRVTATWFIDPPYNNRAGKHYAKRVDDYAELGKWCKTRPGQVIVCENVGATWMPFREHRKIASTRSKNRNHYSAEAIWTGETDPEEGF